MPLTPIPASAIVLVEDEADILLILKRLVASIGTSCDIIAVSTGAAALAQVVLRRVPLVITDYNMVTMNGLQLTTAIKETSPATKVMLITAYATPELEKRAVEHNVDYWVPKPFSMDRVEEIVREVFATGM